MAFITKNSFESAVQKFVKDLLTKFDIREVLDKTSIRCSSYKDSPTGLFWNGIKNSAPVWYPDMLFCKEILFEIPSQVPRFWASQLHEYVPMGNLAQNGTTSKTIQTIFFQKELICSINIFTSFPWSWRQSRVRFTSIRIIDESFTKNKLSKRSVQCLWPSRSRIILVIVPRQPSTISLRS